MGQGSLKHGVSAFRRGESEKENMKPVCFYHKVEF